jgi:Xaa-Pro aminopeptidase
MQVATQRIERAQGLMAQQGIIGLMIMTRDDYRYFFGELRVQPRAIIPVAGPPILIAFAAEEPELRQAAGDLPLIVFRDVAEQMTGVRQAFKTLVEGGLPPGFATPPDGRMRVGMQLWFNTPAFLVDLFRKLNRDLEIVSSDPVMDPLRMVKEPSELALMRQAQEIAALGMDRARQLIAPGISGREIAAEALYTMMRAGAEGTSTPIHVNVGVRSCWIHGMADERPVTRGDLVVVDLTPQVEGYCANLARTFVVGPPTELQTRLFQTYLEMREKTVAMLEPGIKVMELDAAGKRICEEAGLGDYHIDGIAHGIGLRFEETPAPTILKGHRREPLREGMTVAVGHTILAVPGVAGVRVEDVYRVTAGGGEILFPYPVDHWVVGND